MSADMTRLTDALRVSPQQIDPLSWITRPWVSLSFALLALVYGLAATLLTWSQSAAPLINIAAVVSIAGACF